MIISTQPQIIGNCNNEFASLITPFNKDGADQQVLDRLSDGMFICPAAKAARYVSWSSSPLGYVGQRIP